jgi:hypothetical protein
MLSCSIVQNEPANVMETTMARYSNASLGGVGYSYLWDNEKLLLKPLLYCWIT